MAYASHGLHVELGPLPGDQGDQSQQTLQPEEQRMDHTGVGQVWMDATELLCDYLSQYSGLDKTSVLELGAGIGVPGLHAAKLGAQRVVLTDYHPRVLARLAHNCALNGLDESCTVERLEWGVDLASAWPGLLIGADLAATSRSARLLAGTVWGLSSKSSCFVYAHHERRSIFMRPGAQHLLTHIHTRRTCLHANTGPLYIAAALR